MPPAPPSASAILISPDGFPTLRRLLAALRSQTGVSSLELVFVFPHDCPRSLPENELAAFHSSQLVLIPSMHSTAAARAAGVRSATAEIVLFTEDHSLPQPGWLQALLHAHSLGCAAAGPAVDNGNPHSLLSWANLAIEYNEWLHPAPAGPVRHLPGHNSSYRRQTLLSYEPHLDQWLEAESVLHWDLHTRGHSLLLVPAAVTRHHNFSLWPDSLALRFDAGQHFAGMCRLRWPLSRRLLYLAASPLIPLVRLARIARQFLRPGRPARRLPALLPLCLFLLSVESAGALLGYLAGPGSSSRRIAQIDFHRHLHMNPHDRERWLA